MKPLIDNRMILFFYASQDLYMSSYSQRTNLAIIMYEPRCAKGDNSDKVTVSITTYIPNGKCKIPGRVSD